MKTVSVPTRIRIDLNREYMDLANRIGVPVSNLRAQVLEKPELKIQYDIEKLLEERNRYKKEAEELRIENEEQKRIIDEGIVKVRAKQKQFYKLVIDFLDIEEEAKDYILE